MQQGGGSSADRGRGGGGAGLALPRFSARSLSSGGGTTSDGDADDGEGGLVAMASDAGGHLRRVDSVLIAASSDSLALIPGLARDAFSLPGESLFRFASREEDGAGDGGSGSSGAWDAERQAATRDALRHLDAALGDIDARASAALAQDYESPAAMVRKKGCGGVRGAHVLCAFSVTYPLLCSRSCAFCRCADSGKR